MQIFRQATERARSGANLRILVTLLRAVALSAFAFLALLSDRALADDPAPNLECTQPNKLVIYGVPAQVSFEQRITAQLLLCKTFDVWHGKYYWTAMDADWYISDSTDTQDGLFGAQGDNYNFQAGLQNKMVIAVYVAWNFDPHPTVTTATFTVLPAPSGAPP
jgi:hypothetical protein